MSRPELEPHIKGEGITLRAPQMSDFAEWADLRAESRGYLTPWEPTWPADDLTRPAFRRRLRHYLRDLREDQAYPFFIFRDEDDALVGGANLSNIRRGVSQSCSLGYWLGERYAGHGLMTKAVKALLPFAFDRLRLHRVEAACLPSNERSKAVLRRCGFVEEGFARRYLRINGAWRDHVLFAIISDDPR